MRDRPIEVGPGARGFSYYRSAYGTSLLTLLAAVALVLLVVCANVANLMLSRATARRRELSVRMALGAGRWRLMRYLFAESALVAGGGGALGLLVALWSGAALLRLAGRGPHPDPLPLHLDARVLAYTALLALATAVLFGLAPAFKATAVDLATALRAQGRGLAGTAGRGRFGIRKMLVASQVGLSTMLLVASGMLVRSARRLEHADIGLARDRLLVADVDANRAGYSGPRLAALMRDLMNRVRHVPGVAAASLSENGIFSGTESGTGLQVEGFTAAADADTIIAYDDVGPGYFRTVGAHMLLGRDFTPGDNETGTKVAVLNATAAHFFFPHGDAIGRHVKPDNDAYEIVGVVADVDEQDVREAHVRRVYFPTFQMPDLPGRFRLEIAATGDPARLAEPVRRALLAAAPSLVVLRVNPLTDLIRGSISQNRLVATVVSLFGVATLVLAALGLYGTMAYATVQRTSEFGLRIALGERPARVALAVLREAMLLTAVGVAVGLPAALAATRLLRAQLFHVAALDVPSLVLALVVLGVAAVLAGQVPAWHASRVTPLEALRAE